MNLFVIIAVVLTGLAAALVVRPLLRKTEGVPASPVAAFVLGFTLPVAVLGIYLSIGNYDWSATDQSLARAAGNDNGGKLRSIEEMVVGLENRLREDPDNVTGWLLLGRTYTQLGRFSEASDAYRRALMLEPSSEAKLGLAEADILFNRENLLHEAGRLVEEVLDTEPDNPKALFYGGMVSMAHKDVDTFRQRWQRLLTMSPPDEIRTVIESQLAQVGASPGQVDTTKTDSAGDGKTFKGIDVDIRVTDDLAKRIGPGAILYLVARDPERPGPPLAVVRRDAVRVPVKLNISDSNAMIPGRSLASLPRVKLIARITNTGKPVAQPGDIFGEVLWMPKEESGENMSILIDQLVE